MVLAVLRKRGSFRLLKAKNDRAEEEKAFSTSNAREEDSERALVLVDCIEVMCGQKGSGGIICGLNILLLLNSHVARQRIKENHSSVDRNGQANESTELEQEEREAALGFAGSVKAEKAKNEQCRT